MFPAVRRRPRTFALVAGPVLVVALAATAVATAPPWDEADDEPTAEPAVPFGSHPQRYAPGTLFPSEPRSELDTSVVEYYEQWKDAFVRDDCGHGWYQVATPDAEFPYVGEGQGYGMVITVLMAGADPEAKEIFDGLLRWVLDHPSTIDPVLLAAEQDDDCDSVNGIDSATDADLDVAYALLLADRQWGSEGDHDYRELALSRIAAIERSELNPSTLVMRLGDFATPTLGAPTYWVTRTSDWMIGHFRAFGAATGDPVWDRAIASHQRLLANMQAAYSPVTGLLPDFVQDTSTVAIPADRRILESVHDGDFSWNACRVPWRLGTDAVVDGDAESRAAVRLMNRWIQVETAGDPSRIAGGYRLDGTPISPDNEPAFVAPFAVAAMADRDSDSQDWLDALWEHVVETPIDPNHYFEATVTLQVMLVVSGNFWAP